MAQKTNFPIFLTLLLVPAFFLGIFIGLFKNELLGFYFSRFSQPKTSADSPMLTISPTPPVFISRSDSCLNQFSYPSPSVPLITFCLPQTLKAVQLPVNFSLPVTFSFQTDDYRAQATSGPNESSILVTHGYLFSLTLTLPTEDLQTNQPILFKTARQSHTPPVSREETFAVVGRNILLHELGGSTTGNILDAHLFTTDFTAEFSFYFNPQVNPEGEAVFKSLLSSFVVLPSPTDSPPAIP